MSSHFAAAEVHATGNRQPKDRLVSDIHRGRLLVPRTNRSDFIEKRGQNWDVQSTRRAEASQPKSCPGGTVQPEAEHWHDHRLVDSSQRGRLIERNRHDVREPDPAILSLKTDNWCREWRLVGPVLTRRTVARSISVCCIALRHHRMVAATHPVVREIITARRLGTRSTEDNETEGSGQRQNGEPQPSCATTDRLLGCRLMLLHLLPLT